VTGGEGFRFDPQARFDRLLNHIADGEFTVGGQLLQTLGGLSANQLLLLCPSPPGAETP